MDQNKSDKEKKPTLGQESSNNPKFNFNGYWIYGIIAVVFFGMQFLNLGSGAKLTTWEIFETEMLKQQDVQRIVVVNNEIVEIYIKNDKLDSDNYKDVKNNGIGKSLNHGPHYYFPISSVDYFLNELKEAQLAYHQDSKILHAESESRKNWGGEIISWLLPVILMIGIWIFIMKRMSGGGGGGPGGGIFNI